MFYFNVNKPLFFRRIPVVLESRKSSQGGGGGEVAHPLHPPPRSAPSTLHWAATSSNSSPGLSGWREAGLMPRLKRLISFLDIYDLIAKILTKRDAQTIFRPQFWFKSSLLVHELNMLNNLSLITGIISSFQTFTEITIPRGKKQSDKRKNENPKEEIYIANWNCIYYIGL